jgi:hypothetical protein
MTRTNTSRRQPRPARAQTAPALLLLLSATALSLGACSGTSAKSPAAAATVPAVGRPAPPDSLQATLAKQAFTPYAGLGEVVDDGLAPDESMTQLGASCLTDAGYPGDSGNLLTSIFADDGLAVSPPFGSFGFLGATGAAQSGFMPGAIGSGVAAQVGLNPGGRPLGDLPTAAQAEVDKCTAIVQNFTSAQQNGPLAGIRSLGQTISADVQADPDVKKATTAWSACMAKDGYNYTDPNTAARSQAPHTLINTNAAHDGLTTAQYQAQIAAAESDAACTTSTDLAGIYFAVQAFYEQQLVNDDQQKLNAAVQAFRAAYQKELVNLPNLLTTTTTAQANP